jgi:hypothetical protein
MGQHQILWGTSTPVSSIQCAKAAAAKADFEVDVGKQLLAEATTSAKCTEGKIEFHIVGSAILQPNF